MLCIRWCAPLILTALADMFCCCLSMLHIESHTIRYAIISELFGLYSSATCSESPIE